MLSGAVVDEFRVYGYARKRESIAEAAARYSRRLRLGAGFRNPPVRIQGKRSAVSGQLEEKKTPLGATALAES